MDNDAYIIQVFPTSVLPTNPALRTAEVERLELARKTWEEYLEDFRIWNARLTTALEEIRDMDYRGNRSPEHYIATAALEDKDGE